MNNKDEMIFKRCELDLGLCFTSYFHVFPYTDKSNDFVFSLRRYRIMRTNLREIKVRKVSDLTRTTESTPPVLLVYVVGKYSMT